MSDETSKPTPETLADAHQQYRAAKANNIMNDERLNFFRTRMRRRILAGVTFAVGLWVFVSMSMHFDMDWSYPVYIGIAAYALLVAFSSRVARGFMEFPKELVDERIVERRNESYVYTFYLVCTVLALLIPILLFSGVKSYNFAEKVDDPIGGILGFLLFIMMLPYIVFLWREPEL